jgi:archaellum component FlaC
MIELINMSDAHIQNVRREIARLQADANKISEEVARLEQYVEEATVTVEKYRSELNTQTSGDQPVVDSTFTIS